MSIYDPVSQFTRACSGWLYVPYLDGSVITAAAQATVLQLNHTSEARECVRGDMLVVEGYVRGKWQVGDRPSAVPHI